MSWINRETEEVVVQAEMESDFQKIEVTDAYAVKVVEAYLAPSQQQGSKSVSVMVTVENEDGETNKTRFLVMGKDGQTFYEYNGEKRQFGGLSIVNTLFKIALGKEIFDTEPSQVDIKRWDTDTKTMVDDTADGFPDLVGKVVGVCLQMKREIAGADSKEFGEITHFFDNDTGLFSEEIDSDKRKLDRWLRNKKEFITKTIEVKKSSSFGKKAEPTADGEKPKSRWGK